MGENTVPGRYRYLVFLTWDLWVKIFFFYDLGPVGENSFSELESVGENSFPDLGSVGENSFPDLGSMGENRFSDLGFVGDVLEAAILGKLEDDVLEQGAGRGWLPLKKCG